MRISRRQFLVGAASMVGAVALGNGGRVMVRPATASPIVLADPAASGIEHVILVMMENRSFDHFLGWLPGADGRQAGLSYLDKSGVSHATYPLAPDYTGMGHSDPDHSYEGGRSEYNNGACDGWLRAGANDLFSIGYYTQSDLSFLGRETPRWTVFDHYFPSILGPTFPNRIYQHAAQTDRISNTTETSMLPTIWDRLIDRGLSGRYYFNDLPTLALWGDKYTSIIRPFAEFLVACATGALPHVSFVDPHFVGSDENDDHPFTDIRKGEMFLDTIFQAVTQSPAWLKTVLIINFDEWGGFFDHVPPPVGPTSATDRAAGNTDGRLGFRVPCLLISPWSPRGHVSHTVYDHTSVLKLIEWRWNLQPLTARDAAANNLAAELDFSQVKHRYVPAVVGRTVAQPTPTATPQSRSRGGCDG